MAEMQVSEDGAAKVGKFLGEYRLGLNLSLREFALLLGTDHKRLKAIEKGESQVTREMLIRFCESSGFSIDEILAYAGMLRYEYTDGLRIHPNLFVTLLQLLSPKNTPKSIGRNLDKIASHLRVRYSLTDGDTQIDVTNVAAIYEFLGNRFKKAAAEIRKSGQIEEEAGTN